MYLVERFVRKNCDSTCCNFLNIKLHHGYFSTNLTYKVLRTGVVKTISRTDYFVNE